MKNNFHKKERQMAKVACWRVKFGQRPAGIFEAGFGMWSAPPALCVREKKRNGGRQMGLPVPGSFKHEAGVSINLYNIT